jgi:hypothetical protein
VKVNGGGELQAEVFCSEIHFGFLFVCPFIIAQKTGKVKRF